MYISACPYPICLSSSYPTDPACISTWGPPKMMYDVPYCDCRLASPLRLLTGIATRAARARRCRLTSGSPHVDHRVKGKRHGR